MPSFTMTATLAGAALAFFANTASAHLIMQKPVPFGVDSLDNSPLEDAFPGNYPCKQRTGVYDVTTMNFMKVGEPQELSFEGSASHGGGSCQLAVSLDTEPTANSTFKIIQVFEGGCPVSSDGNTGTHPFTFAIPEGFPNGISTFAWYWNNRVGNREAYMNCAPITVTGGSDNLDYYDSLPNLFLVNLPSSDCEAPDSTSVTIPNPGQFVLKDPQGSLAAPSGPKCSAYAAAQTEGVKGYQSATKSNVAAYKAPASAAGSTGKAAPDATPASELGGGSGSGPGGAPAAPTAPAGGAPAGGAPSGGPSPPAGSAQAPAGGSYGGGPPSQATSAAAGGPPSQVTISTAVSSAPAAAAPTSSAAAPSSAAAAAPSSYAAANPSGVAAPSGAAAPSTGSGACSSTPGISCSSDGQQFGMCTAGGEMVWQKVASGTKCENGGIVKKRDVDSDVQEFRNPHVRRHVRAAGMHRGFQF